MSQIKKARVKARLTQEELAVRLKVSTTVVGYWEQGVRSPALRRLREIARILGVSVDKLVDEKMKKANGNA
jgi:transcriptional regulator with XRE-family HTH domain